MVILKAFHFTFLRFRLLEDLAAEQGVMPQIKTIEGLVSAMESVVGEAPAFFFGGWVVSKIGHGHAMTLVFAAMGIRYVSKLADPRGFRTVVSDLCWRLRTTDTM